MTLCDEQSYLPTGNDQNFIGQVFLLCDTDKHQAVSKSLRQKNSFTVNHFAGSVHYSMLGFIQKNANKFNDSLQQVVLNSSFEFMTALFGHDENEKSVIKKRYISFLYHVFSWFFYRF